MKRFVYPLMLVSILFGPTLIFAQVNPLVIGEGDQPSVASTANGLIGITYGLGKDIFFSESKDGGRSFSEPEKVANHPGLILGMSSGPQLAMTEEAYVIVAPDRKGNLSLWQKLKGGSEWQGPFRVNDLEGSAGENLAAMTFDSKGTLYATWIDTRRAMENHASMDHSGGGHAVKEREAGEGHEKEVRRREPEKKESHDMPVPLTEEQLKKEIGEMPEGAKGISQYQGPDGKMYWVVLDAEGNALKAKDMASYQAFKARNAGRRKPQGKIFMAKSDDSGKTWTKSKLVYASPDGSVCECCKPSMVNDGTDIYIMFRNNVQGSRDLYFTRSSDQGNTFTSPEKLGDGTWKINGCPMDGGGVMVSDDQLASVWQREGSVYAAMPGLPEQLLGQGRSPSVAITSQGTYYFWNQAGRIVSKSPNSPMLGNLGTGSAFRVVSLEKGVLGVWVQNGKVVSRKIS